MLNYKKSLILSGIISLIVFIFTLFIMNGKTYFSSIYVHILNDYTYAVFFSMLLFINMFDSMDQSLVISRFENVENYLKYMIVEKMKSYGVLFFIMTLFQVILFFFVDDNFNVGTLLYRNFVFFILINFVYQLVLIGRNSKKTHRIVFMFLFWNITYFVSIVMPKSIINHINIFTLLQKIQISEIIRYTILLIAIIVFLIWRISNKRRYIKIWLD